VTIETDRRPAPRAEQLNEGGPVPSLEDWGVRLSPLSWSTLPTPWGPRRRGEGHHCRRQRPM